MVELTIRQATLDDCESLLTLYHSVSERPGGLARLQNEIDHDYITDIVSFSLERGICLLAETGGDVVAEIHAYSPQIFCFGHVLSDLTIAVSPALQGSGVGRKLFERFMQDVLLSLPSIERVELIARESNVRAISFYESLGFKREGCLHRRIRNIDGSLENDIPMAWIRDAK